MTKRQRKVKKKSAQSPPQHTGRRINRPPDEARKPSKRSVASKDSRSVHGEGQPSRQRLDRFAKFAADMGLAELSDSNGVLAFVGNLYVPDALAALPRPMREFTIRCEYSLRMPIGVPFACAFAPEAPAENGPPPRRLFNVSFGAAGKRYAFVRHEGSGHLPGLAVCRAVDAGALYGEWLEALRMATASVNSSPRSPDFFHSDPDIFDVGRCTKIMAELGIAPPPKLPKNV